MTALRKATANQEPFDEGRRTPAVFDADRMRRAFEKVSRVPAQQEPDEGHRDEGRRRFDLAYSRLDRAATVFDLLLTRCLQLEAHVKGVTERAKAEAAERERVIAALKEHATEMHGRLEEADRQMETMAAQSAALERRAEAFQAAAESAAAEAKTLSMELHDRVFAALGLCSRVHGALESVAVQAAAVQSQPAKIAD